MVARLEAELLLAHVLGVERSRLLTWDRLTPAELRAFDDLIARRAHDAEPVSQLLGRRGFRDVELIVDARVLTPRPETEELVEAWEALESRGLVPPGPLADWGTGSGALAVVASRRRPVLALELSADARAVAAANIGALGGPCAVQLVAARGLSSVASESLAVVLANPPYVEEWEWKQLAADVRCHEPRMALVPPGGQAEPLYTELGKEAWRCLLPGGWLLVEVGAGQAQRLEQALVGSGLEAHGRRLDLAGHERVLLLRKP